MLACQGKKCEQIFYLKYLLIICTTITSQILQNMFFEYAGSHGAPPAKMSSRAAWMSPPVACRARRISSSSWIPISRSCWS